MLTRQQAKNTLKMRGHSYRSAAEALGRNYRHVAAVLSGERESKSLLAMIAEIPARRNCPSNSPYRFVERSAPHSREV
jgi:hypothetical protein